MIKELKARAYDLFASIQHHERVLKQVNDKIQELQTAEIAAQTAPAAEAPVAAPIAEVVPITQ